MTAKRDTDDSTFYRITTTSAQYGLYFVPSMRTSSAVVLHEIVCIGAKVVQRLVIRVSVQPGDNVASATENRIRENTLTFPQPSQHPAQV